MRSIKTIKLSICLALTTHIYACNALTGSDIANS